MMDIIQELSNQVSVVGFPIVCVFLLWKQMQNMTQQHKEEMDKLSEAVHNNTIAINKLTDYIELKIGGEKK